MSFKCVSIPNVRYSSADFGSSIFGGLRDDFCWKGLVAVDLGGEISFGLKDTEVDTGLGSS